MRSLSRRKAHTLSRQLTTAKGPVTIRPALPDDAALLRELRLEALASHPEAFASDPASAAVETVEAWAERIARYASQAEGVICVARTQNQFIGMMGLYGGNRPKTRHGGTIYGAYVKADWRGLHVAEALLNECIAWAQTHGLTIVKLAVVTTNAPAIRCYVRCGFMVYGVDPKVIRYNGVFHDELLMARMIQ
jgi:ribosomal protein S18 acetylase RimI-like enzyme